MSSRLSGIGMTSQRTRMRMIKRLREQGIVDEAVLNVMNEIPRHIFVEEALASRAYEDFALPLGFGQTISQPYIVARMTELLIAGKPRGKILEIGTGCGYQTAILARLATEVYSVERLLPLLAMARKNLREMLGCLANVFADDRSEVTGNRLNMRNGVAPREMAPGTSACAV